MNSIELQIMAYGIKPSKNEKEKLSDRPQKDFLFERFSILKTSKNRGNRNLKSLLSINRHFRLLVPVEFVEEIPAYFPFEISLIPYELLTSRLYSPNPIQLCFSEICWFYSNIFKTLHHATWRYQLWTSEKGVPMTIQVVASSNQLRLVARLVFGTYCVARKCSTFT